jgi:hypothetical protein
VAEGRGSKPDDALAEARRRAVRQVVAALLDSRTLAREENTINDKVLSAAASLIKWARPLAQRNQGEAVVVRLAAAVDRPALAARLKEAGLTVKAGLRGVGTDLAPDDQIREHGAEVLNDVLSDLPLTLVCAGRVVKVEVEDHAVKVEMRLRADMEAYNQVARRLLKVLDVLQVGKQSFTVDSSGAGPELGRRRSAARTFPPRELNTDSKATIFSVLTEIDPPGVKTMDAPGARMQWDQYAVGFTWRPTAPALAGRQYVLVTAFGPGGLVAGSALTPLEADQARYLENIWYKWTWGAVGRGTPPRQNVYVMPLGLSLRAAREGQLDCRLEQDQFSMVMVEGIDPRQVVGVSCTPVVLPE